MSSPHERGVESPADGPLAAGALPGEVTLPRLLGPFDATCIVVGSMIGSGIFLKAERIAQHLGSVPVILLVWVAGGLAALCGSLAVAELAAMTPQAGGPFVYLRQAYGRKAAFLWGWTEFSITRTGSLGSLACGTVIYFNALLEALEGQGLLPPVLADMVPLSHFAQCLITVLAVLLLASINIVGTRQAAVTQNLTTLLKVAFLGLLIVGPWTLGTGSVENLETSEPVAGMLRGFGLALVAVFWPYDGWINLTTVAEEVREPHKNVPLALTLGMLVVIVIYVGANIGYHAVLPMQVVQETPTVAAAVTARMLGTWGAVIASLGVMISTFGALNSNMLVGPRIYFAMARDGLFPRVLRRIHSRFLTPAHSISAQSLWAILQIGIVFAITTDPKKAFDTLTDFVILGSVGFYALAVSAVYVMRRRDPSAVRPYRTWGYPVTPLIYIAAVVAVIASTIRENPMQIAAVAALLLVGLGLYRFFRKVEAGETA
jgi:APA family basic amino acid/polyamine antiporter